MHSHTTHTHTQRINALGLPPAISVGFPLLLLLLLSLSLFSLAAAPPLREGGRERESQRERERKIPTSQLWKPQLLARPRGYTSSLPANRNGGVRTARFHAKAATDLIGQTKETKKSPCAHESRGRKRETSLWFSKESEGERRGWEGRLLGVGKGLEIHGCPKVRFYSVRNDTTRLPPWLLRRLAVDVKKEEEGGLNVCGRAGRTAYRGRFFISRFYNRQGSRGYSPVARNTAHMARPPLASSPLHTERRREGRREGRWRRLLGRHFQKPAFAYEVCVLLQEGCSPSCLLMLHTYLTKESTDWRKQRNVDRISTTPSITLFTFSVCLFLFLQKVRSFKISFWGGRGVIYNKQPQISKAVISALELGGIWLFHTVRFWRKQTKS